MKKIKRSMDTNIKYKIIGREFGMPPIGSIMYWDDGYDCWVVNDAYNTGSDCKSMWHGNPEELPHLYEPIIEYQPKKKIRYPHIFNTLNLNGEDIYL